MLHQSALNKYALRQMNLNIEEDCYKLLIDKNEKCSLGHRYYM